MTDGYVPTHARTHTRTQTHVTQAYTLVHVHVKTRVQNHAKPRSRSALHPDTAKTNVRIGLKEGSVRAGARLETAVSLAELIQSKSTGVSVPASVGLNTNEPSAQIQPQVTRRPKSVAGATQGGRGLSGPHSQDYKDSCI